MSNATFAHGTKLHIGTDEIGEITNVSGPTPTSDELDTTSHGADGWRTFIQGLKDGGTVTIDGNFSDEAADNQSVLHTKFASGDVENCAVEWPDGTIWSFDAFVQEPQQPDAPVDDVLTFSATLKVTGNVNFSGSVPT